VVDKVLSAIEGQENAVICLLGLAYKENVDDFRESPSVQIAQLLRERTSAELLVVEPFMDSSEAFTLVPLEEGIARASVVVHLTAHDAFKALDAASLAGKQVIDLRGNLKHLQ
jgi:UDP-N-acetyl-D-mannosaminuronic acid dehydrogenase